VVQDIARVDDATADDALRVYGEMTIYRAVEISQSLFAEMHARHGDFKLDLSQVTEFDTAGLQILLMARQLAEASGQQLEFTHASECVMEVLQLCNVPASTGQVAA
jgi:anti-anti-sigma factor